MNIAPLSVAPLALPFHAQLTLPGSKSHANRAIVAACLADGTTFIRNATPCDDVRVMVDNLKVLGFDVTWMDEAAGHLRVVGGIPNVPDASGELFCENAGTTLRFLCSVAALVPGRWTVTGNEHMRRRPIGDLVQALKSLGAEIWDTGGKPPVTIQGGTLAGGSVTVDAAKSSQFLSSLLLIAPALQDGLRVTVKDTLASPGYVELTERVLKDFGVAVTREGGAFVVAHGHPRAVASYDIEGDWSAAGVWLMLEKISGGRAMFTNLHHDSSQSDRLLPQAIAAIMKPGNATVDCTDIPDQVMNLALLGAFRDGTLNIIGARNLRFKECDRLAVITSELSKAGIAIREHDDGVTVTGGPAAKRHLPHTPVTLDPHDDHRMAMVFAALGLVRGGISIENPGCVAKSYPNFFEHVEHLRASPKAVAIVGMRGSGKTNLAKRMSKALSLPQLDTDQVIEGRVGPLDSYIEQHGWPAFRAAEEEAVETSLRPGTIVSLGGGACESAKTRGVLKERAIVVWLHATVEGTVERLKNVKKKRPALTDLSLEEEVTTTLERRNPQYKEVATIELSHRIPFPAQVPKLLARLKRLTSSYDPHTERFIPPAEQFAKPPRRGGGRDHHSRRRRR